VHEQQQAHHRGEREVRRDHQAPLRQTVDNDAAEWSDQARDSEEEEDEPRLRVRSGEDTRPDAERDEHRPVAEHREELPAEQKADVPAVEDRAHAGPSSRGRSGRRR
jgi:hypothetical protein